MTSSSSTIRTFAILSANHEVVLRQGPRRARRGYRGAACPGRTRPDARRREPRDAARARRREPGDRGQPPRARGTRRGGRGPACTARAARGGRPARAAARPVPRRRQRRGPPLPEPAPRADQARGEVELIRELIDDILFLSELETGRAVVALGETRALPFVTEVLGKLGETATRAGVKLRAEGDPDATLPLRPRMLRVLTENLAQNAIRYAGPGSTFTVTVAPGELRAADDGAGVAEEDLPRLFERFFRADRVRGSRGTGLGLAVVKHIVVAGGGMVEAEGAPGHGLTITCAFSAR